MTITMWDDYMREALALAARGPRSQNPQVGCVIVDDAGEIIGRGWHRGAGTPLAVVAALVVAGPRARGATAVVTLEPCRHTGRTGPCTDALREAGIAHVVFAQDDPTSQASGGAALLSDVGMRVTSGVLAAQAEQLTRGWTSIQRHARPYLTLKCAMTMDGRVADSSGGPTSITGETARRWVHGERGRTDAIIVGTGTALMDNPSLTARQADGTLEADQPLRVVVGMRDIPADSAVLDTSAETLLVRSHDPQALIAALIDAGVHEAIVEGGPTLAGALVEADVIDAFVWLIAPGLLGAGVAALPPLAAPRRLNVSSVEVLGEDLKIEGTIDVHRHR